MFSQWTCVYSKLILKEFWFGFKKLSLRQWILRSLTKKCEQICSWLYVFIMSHACFRVNLHSVVIWMPRRPLLETGTISELSLSDYNGIWTHNHLVRKRTLDNLAKWPVWLNGWVCVYELSACGFEPLCSHLGLFLVFSNDRSYFHGNNF